MIEGKGMWNAPFADRIHPGEEKEESDKIWR